MSIPGGTILAVRRGLYWHVGIADGRGHAISRTRGRGLRRGVPWHSRALPSAVCLPSA